MMLKLKDKKHTVVLLYTIIISNYCLSQDFRPKVKKKLDSLYPKALYVGWNGKQGFTQDIEIKCNCPEFGSYMTLTFDTNANLLIKEYFYNSLKPLPKSILRYIKKNTSQTVRIVSEDIVCRQNNLDCLVLNS